MMVPFFEVWRIVWTHEGDACDPRELTVHSGGHQSGGLDSLMRRCGVILAPSEG